ncbi:hypothetical protein JVT61DRAFT_13079 [Boletus reticuloceps]|uniref:WIBG Mago-binding domain-containing protein n=1 Tax=Boletus reticuloceps TaxID=495285 RepID=A0A8I2YYF6_9AGAM|nr:hypothetical protein JVT61DRAFT_13079 [Boletus reticuloceps]
MSRPPLFPQQSASGIAVDPRTFERVIPESRRLDGSVRREIKIRPGFTPQEDVSRFRGTRQQAMDATALPKGHILGWVAPSSESQQKAKGASTPPPNKNAKKRANQRARKAAGKAETVKDSWEDEEDVESGGNAPTTARTPASMADDGSTKGIEEGTDRAEPTSGEAEITDMLSKLDVK